MVLSTLMNWIWVLLMINTVDCNRRKCLDSSYCFSNHEFCDTATGWCSKCTSYPCHPNTIRNQGDGMCRDKCQEFWLQTAAVKVLPLVHKIEDPIPPAKNMNRNEKANYNNAANNSPWLINNTQGIIITVVLSLAVMTVIGLIIITVKWDKIKHYKEKVPCFGLNLPVQEQGDNHGQNQNINQAEQGRNLLNNGQNQNINQTEQGRNLLTHGQNQNINQAEQGKNLLTHGQNQNINQAEQGRNLLKHGQNQNISQAEQGRNLLKHGQNQNINQAEQGRNLNQ